MAFTRYTIQNNYSPNKSGSGINGFKAFAEIYYFFMTEMPEFWSSIKLEAVPGSNNSDSYQSTDDVAYAANNYLVFGNNIYRKKMSNRPDIPKRSRSYFSNYNVTIRPRSNSSTYANGESSIHFFDDYNDGERFSITITSVNGNNDCCVLVPTFYTYNTSYQWLYRHYENSSTIQDVQGTNENSDVEQILYKNSRVYTSDRKTISNSYTPGYFFQKGIRGQCLTTNWIKEIIKINENTVAFTYGSGITTDITSISKGVLILTKSNKGNISIIAPSEGLCNSRYTAMIGCATQGNYIAYMNEYPNYTYIKINGEDDIALINPAVNKLLCMNVNSVSSPMNYASIPYESNFGDKTILNPILVPNCDEYIPKCFYVPISQYIIPANNDTFLFINGKKYWYNGFIAVELDDE